MPLLGCSGVGFGPWSGSNARDVGVRHAGFRTELDVDLFQVMPHRVVADS